MNTKELSKMKTELYQNALKDGTIGKINFICRELDEDDGSPCGYGPKYNLKVDDLLIHVDDYGHYSEVTKDGNKLMSTHYCSQLFAVGGWEEKILKLLPKAQESKEKRELELEQKEAKKLAKELGVI